MKKSTALLLAVLCCFAVCCLLIWRQSRAEQHRWQQLCQGSAGQAAEHFRQYLDQGAPEHYWYGMAEFRVFMTAYHLYQEDAPGEDYNYNLCSAVYGQMALHPEQVQANLPQLIEALDLLKEDCQSANGFLQLDQLKNQLLHG